MKKDENHVPNDHGKGSEPAVRGKDKPAESAIEDAAQTSGLNEVQSEGTHGAYEGFENTEGNEFSGDTPDPEFEKEKK